jgi:hypothetical protein
MDFLILEISQKWTYTTYSPYNCLISLTDSMVFLCCMTSQYISLNYQILYCMDIPHPSVDRKVPFIFKMLQWSQAWWYTFVIPVTHEVEIRRITIWGQTRQEVSKTTSQPTKKLGVIACACHPRYVGGITGTLQSGMAQEKLWDPIWKITKIKRAGRTGSGGRVPAWDPLFKLQHHKKKKKKLKASLWYIVSPPPHPQKWYNEHLCCFHFSWLTCIRMELLSHMKTTVWFSILYSYQYCMRAWISPHLHWQSVSVCLFLIVIIVILVCVRWYLTVILMWPTMLCSLSYAFWVHVHLWRNVQNSLPTLEVCCLTE